MKSYFAINHNPDAKDLKQLAQKTGLTKRVLQVRISFYLYSNAAMTHANSSIDLNCTDLMFCIQYIGTYLFLFIYRNS